MEDKSDQFRENLKKIKFLLSDKNVVISEIEEDRDCFYDVESGKFYFSIPKYTYKDTIEYMLEMTNLTIQKLTNL